VGIWPSPSPTVRECRFSGPVVFGLNPWETNVDRARTVIKSLKFGGVAELNTETVWILHVKALRALFVGLRSNTSRLQVSND
jgi:hypothetical protein